MKKIVVLIISSFLLFSCAKEIIIPNYIHFKKNNESTVVYAYNNLKSPIQLEISENASKTTSSFVIEPLDTIKVLHFDSKLKDTLNILKKYNFRAALGNPRITHYDTLYNYQLPFKKGKEYKVIQGYNGSFSHYKDYSRYAIDFKMPVGDTIVAPRNGWVVTVLDRYDKQGLTQEYRKYGNFITLYHDDGTFSQYVHLKKKGALVKLNDYVKIGEPIAISGFTGLTTEPHLHFAVFKPIKNNIKSIPIILNSIPGNNYKKDKYYINE